MTVLNVTDANVSSSCNEVDSTSYDLVLSALCGTLCLFGLVYAFFGYRCFKAVMFLSGLIFGGTTVFMICREERILQQAVSIELAAGISVGIGILCGFITLLVRYVGLFLQGFFLGVLVAFAGIIGLQSFYHPSTPWIPAGILFGTGVVCSVLTLKYQKQLIIISTAVFGSVLITLCIDYFIERFFLFRYAWEALMASPPWPECWFAWVILAVWPALSLSGILIQWNVTSQGYDHTDVIIVQGRRKPVRTHLVRPQRERIYSTVDRRPPTRRNTSVVSQDRSERRPHRPQDSRAAPTARGRPLDEVAAPSTSPPSYFECVELGVGEPVNEDHDVIRTELGAFVSRRSQPPDPAGNPLIEQVRSGGGYSIDPSQPSSSGGYLAAASSRAPRPTRGAPHGRGEPDHQPIERFAGPSRPKRGPGRVKPAQKQTRTTNKHRSQVGGARRHRVSPGGPSSRPADPSRNSDTQLLLSDSSNARCHRDVIAAHAQRIRQAQVQESSRPPLQSSRPPLSNTPSHGGAA